MTEGPRDSNSEIWRPAPTTNVSSAPTSLPPGVRLGVWLLWLCFGLPASSIVFLGIPAMLAWFAVGMLDKVGVPLEVWTELEPWVALLMLATMVNHRASFTHRRAIESGERSSFVVLWVAGGGLAVLTWAGLLGLELVPRTEVLPPSVNLHFWRPCNICLVRSSFACSTPSPSTALAS